MNVPGTRGRVRVRDDDMRGHGSSLREQRSEPRLEQSFTFRSTMASIAASSLPALRFPTVAEPLPFVAVADFAVRFAGADDAGVERALAFFA